MHGNVVTSRTAWRIFALMFKKVKQWEHYLQLISKLFINKVNSKSVDVSELPNIILERPSSVNHQIHDVCFVWRQAEGVTHTLARVAPFYSSLHVFSTSSSLYCSFGYQ